jgi:hypothetical protein
MPALIRRRLVPLALLALGSLSTVCSAGGPIQNSANPANVRPRHLRSLMDAARSKANVPDTAARRVVLLPPEEGEPEAAPPPKILPAGRMRLASNEPVVAGNTVVPAPAVERREPDWLGGAQGFLVPSVAIAAAGVLFLLLVAIRKRGDCGTTIADRNSAANHDAGSLQPLIANRLRIVEETLVLPPLACLHGKPVASPRYRVDPAQRPGDPHFVPAPVEVPIEMETASWFSDAERGIHEPTYLRRAAGGTVRTPASLEGER